MSKKIHGMSKRSWKCFFVGFALAWVCAGGCCAAFAGVPVKFTVETSRAEVREVQCYHGETLDFDVSFKSYGKDFYFPTNAEAQIFWQTNGMSAFYWRTNNVTVVSNRMEATFTPEMDPGAGTVFGFIGIPGDIYRASFVLRLKQSPGWRVKEMEWPYRELDFSKVEMKNVPFYFKDESDEVLIDAIKNATNKLYQVLHHEVETATPGNYEVVSNRAMNAVQKSQRVNNKPLAGDITLGPSDLAMYSNAEIDTALGKKVGYIDNDLVKKNVDIGGSNIADGGQKYSLLVGENNRLTGMDNSIVAGRSNYANATEVLIAGYGNSISSFSQNSIVLGRNNKVENFQNEECMLFGSGNTSRAKNGYILGYSSWVTAQYGLALGYGAWADHTASFSWNGDSSLQTAYKSHGAGTFNVNPIGGAEGFYIGSQTLAQLLSAARPADYESVKAKANSAMQPENTYNKTQTDALLEGKRGLDDFNIYGGGPGWRFEEVEKVRPLADGETFGLSYHSGLDDYWFIDVVVNKTQGQENIGTSGRFYTRQEAMACTNFVVASGTAAGKRVWYGAQGVIDKLAKKSETVPVTRKINGQPLTNDITVVGMPTTGIVWSASAMRTANGEKTIGAGDVGAYTKAETDALIESVAPEYEDIPSNVVWRIEAEGGRFYFKPVRPINMED